MKLIRGIKNLRHRFKKPVLTIGIFDGVHLAHQRIIKEVVRQAKILKGTSVVLTFTPHPLKILKKHPPTLKITSLEHRIDLIGQLNVGVCLLLDFNKKFSEISADDFIRHILIDIIGVDYVIIGEGFRFGKNRDGSFSLLKKFSKIYGFKIRQIKTVKINGRFVSSSKIRSLIQKGKIVEANRFLGREFSICGKIKRGSARGRFLGYPTANIEPHEKLVPWRGVYAVLVKLDNKPFPGILNVGARPTFRSKQKSTDTIEVHIFDFHNKIYGKEIEVFFIQRIRCERKFISRQALLEQIKKDELKARKILKARKSPPL